MAYATDRVILYSRTFEPMGDLAPDEVISRVRHEVINLEHTLTLVTTRPLVEGTRLLTQDGTGKWREWVVSTPDDKHETGEHAIGTYVCIWSLQYDLMGCDDGAHAEPGMGSSCTGALAVAAALDGTDRWEVGSVDVAAVEAGKGCVMTIGKTAWERMSLVVDKWGGEVDAEIEVDSAGVVSRAVALRAHLGQTSVTRRFDWGHDLKSIRRTPEPGPRYCGIVPLGRGQTEYAEDDETTFEWPLTLTGDPEYYPEYTEDYILDPEASLAFRVPDGDGGWEYPKKTVTYDTDDVGELYELASADLHDQTHPKVTYEGDVLQFAAAGMEAQGVQLGDDVQTVDHGFAVDAPLHIQGRVVELEVNELSPRTDTHLVIGYVPETVASLLSSTISSAVTPLSRRISRIEGDTSIVHLQDLIDAINAEINATGGWWYAVPGMGTRTYDTAVTDPSVGTEASKVVEIRGGSIRIANSRTSGGDWDWKTLIVSGHIAAELVTAVNVTAGWIGNPSGTTFFDIDNDQLVIGGRTESQIMDELDSAGIDKIEYGTSASSTTSPTSWSTTVPTSVSKGSWLWIRTTYKNGTTSMTKAYAGTDGQNGADGIGITSVTPQYYLSTSSSSATGGSWSSNPPTWSANHYIWTRSLITWDTTPSTTSTTTEVYDAALTQANQQAVESAKVATDYITDGSSGTDFAAPTGNAKMRILPTGMEIFDGNGDSALFAGLSGSNSIVRVGKASGSGNVVMSSEGYVDVRNASTVMAHFGYGEGKNSDGGTSIAPYYDIGTRKSGTTVGNYSVAEGKDSTASGYISHAEGSGSTASGVISHAEGVHTTASGNESHAEGAYTTASGEQSHAEGWQTTASGGESHAEGLYTTASGNQSHAEGANTIANGDYQHVQGKHNISSSSYADIVGWGVTGSRKNIEYLTSSGNLWIAGSLAQNSDQRLKEHHAYLGEDACDFIRKLKPALYTKDGERHVGFYAQNVQEAEPDEWDTVTVTEQHTDESLDFDPLTLDYTALIAPLVAYAQNLERQVESLTERLNALEGKVS